MGKRGKKGSLNRDRQSSGSIPREMLDVNASSFAPEGRQILAPELTQFIQGVNQKIEEIQIQNSYKQAEMAEIKEMDLKLET